MLREIVRWQKIVRERDQRGQKANPVKKWLYFVCVGLLYRGLEVLVCNLVFVKNLYRVSREEFEATYYREERLLVEKRKSPRPKWPGYSQWGNRGVDLPTLPSGRGPLIFIGTENAA